MSDLQSASQPDIRTVGAHPDHWYPVAWADDVKAGHVIQTRWSGDSIALYRTRSGIVTALENRCAHRQVPLHLGAVDGDRLRCGYYGWAYDASGKCVDVPYLGSCRMPNGVRSYPVRELSGMVMIFPGDPAIADARFPDALGAASDNRYRTGRLDRRVNCHYSFLHENLFDMNHQFLHRHNMGSIKAKCLGSRSGSGWCEVEYTFARASGRQSLGEAAILGALRTKAGGFRDLMRIRTAYPYQHLSVWVGKGEDPALNVWLCYTPQDKDQRTNRTFGFLSVKKAAIPGLTLLAWPLVRWFTERIFLEDKIIVEAEQAAWDSQGRDLNQEVFPPILKLRETLIQCGARSG